MLLNNTNSSTLLCSFILLFFCDLVYVHAFLIYKTSSAVLFQYNLLPFTFQQPREVLDLVSILEEQERRKTHVHEVCVRNSISPDKTPIVPSTFHAMFVDERYKFIYCEVPKVACTNWKRIMLILTGKMNTTNPMELSAAEVHGDLMFKYLRRLDTYKPKEIRTVLNTYFKVMFVRHPLERLLSAFRNKFTVSYNQYFPLKYGRKIIRKYRKDASQKALNKGHDVRFEEFVKYLIDLKQSNEPYNAHWREYYKLCHPCMVQYDIIGKYDTLEQDVDYILKILGVDDLIKFPPKPSHKGPSTHELLKQSYKNVTSFEIHKLWEMYAVDFAMFGYKYPDF